MQEGNITAKYATVFRIVNVVAIVYLVSNENTSAMRIVGVESPSPEIWRSHVACRIISSIT